MKYAALLALFTVTQEMARELKPVCDNMDKVKSYHFVIKVIQDEKEKAFVEGEYFFSGAMHARMEKIEIAKAGDKRYIKKDGEWKKAPSRPNPGKAAQREEDLSRPHEWARRIVGHCPEVKREKSTKIGAVPVDIYVHSLRLEAARKSFEGGGMPVIGSVIDWSKTKNGVLFYVGRDDLLYRVDQRLDGNGDKKVDRELIIEFSEFNVAKCRLPDDLKENLGIK